jgi:hypothetical protein
MVVVARVEDAVEMVRRPAQTADANTGRQTAPMAGVPQTYAAAAVVPHPPDCAAALANVAACSHQNLLERALARSNGWWESARRTCVSNGLWVS